MLWVNKTGVNQVFYDNQIEPVSIRPVYAISDLDVNGVRPKSFTPITSIYEILDQKPDASIRLVRVSSIGDILLLFPVFYRIKELYPECRLSFASVKRYLPLIKYIDFIEPVDEKKAGLANNIDFGYDFNLTIERAERYGWGKNFHRSEIYARILGIEIPEYRYTLPYSDVEKIEVLNIMKSKGYDEVSADPIIGFQLRGANESRSFPLEKIKNVIKRLTETGIRTVLIDGDRNIGWEGTNIINMCGTVDVLGLAALIDMCDLAVSTDSGVTHLAGAVEKKNVAFFGCIPAKNRVKYPNCHVVDLAKEWGCESSECWEGGGRCGRQWSCLIDADENLIFDRITEQLK